MKQKVTVLIGQQHRNKLPECFGKVIYETTEEGLGEVDAYLFYHDFYDEEGLHQLLEPFGPYEIERREFSFTKAEKDKAQIFSVVISDRDIVSESREHSGVVCRSCISLCSDLCNIHPIFVPKRKIKRHQISTTYAWNNEIMIQNELAEELESNFNIGASYYKIYDVKTGNEISGFKRMIPKIGIGKVVPPTITVPIEFCEVCGTHKELLIKTPSFFKANTWSGLDLCYSQERFGPRLNGSHEIIVSKRLRDYLVSKKVKDLYFWPEFLVD